LTVVASGVKRTVVNEGAEGGWVSFEPPGRQECLMIPPCWQVGKCLASDLERY
jgi:hypothetical protein